MDIFTLLDAVVDDPELYGFSNATDSCISPDVYQSVICKRPDLYVFWDAIHPSQHAHQVIAQHAAEIINSF